MTIKTQCAGHIMCQTDKRTEGQTERQRINCHSRIIKMNLFAFYMRATVAAAKDNKLEARERKRNAVEIIRI